MLNNFQKFTKNYLSMKFSNIRWHLEYTARYQNNIFRLIYFLDSILLQAKKETLKMEKVLSTDFENLKT